MGCEEGFNVELGRGLLLSKSFCINTATHGGVFEAFDSVGVRVIGNSFRQGLFPANGDVLFGQFEKVRCTEGFNDGRVGLEATHALEGLYYAQGDRVVCVAAGLGEEELVHGKV